MIGALPPIAGPKNTSKIHANTTISDPFISERTNAPTVTPIPA